MMKFTFDVTVSATTDDLEVRLMCDQDPNKNVGIGSLKIDALETEDHIPPVLQLIGPSFVTVLLSSQYVDAGASCTDAVDGVLAPNMTTSVSTALVGLQSVIYQCTDLQANVASIARDVQVVDDSPAQVVVRAGLYICVLEQDSYVEQGAECIDNYDPVTDANVTGLVDTSIPGTYSVTYTCTDSSGHTSQNASLVVVISGAPPGNLVVQLFSLQTSRSGMRSEGGSCPCTSWAHREIGLC